MVRKYFYFLFISYLVAFLFETLANTIGDGKLFQAPNWLIFFLIWYGTIYTLTYLVFRKRPLWQVVLTWAILGPILEIIVFKRFNPIIDPIIYGLMFLFPFWIYKKYLKASK